MFPRFFFVSDPALLEILGQASDSHTIQNHLMSIFDNTRAVKFHEVDYNKITAIVSSEAEVIQVILISELQNFVQIPIKLWYLTKFSNGYQLERAVRAEGSVETWLTSLLNTSQQSIHSIIRNAFTMMSDPNFSILSFLEKMPAQVNFNSIIP